MELRLQPTGYMPFTVPSAEEIGKCREHRSDKRGILVTIYDSRLLSDRYFAEIVYLTSWEDEHDFTWVVQDTTLDGLALLCREIVRQGILPPGAGYPAMPEYAARQGKLEGAMRSLALHCITQALAQAAES